MFGVSHGALQFMAYEELKKRANKFKGVGAEAKLVGACLATQHFARHSVNASLQVCDFGRGTLRAE